MLPYSTPLSHCCLTNICSGDNTTAIYNELIKNLKPVLLGNMAIVSRLPRQQKPAAWTNQVGFHVSPRLTSSSQTDFSTT